jgi:predicted NUDIX family NTP pyrophosphohydrolase
MKQSAGTVLYRLGDQGTEVLLVHPSGNYNRHAPWSIPKGLPNPGESLEDAARRETQEETGMVAGELRELGFVDYVKSKKRIHAFAGECPSGEPTCQSWEVDRAEFVPLGRAYELLHVDQRPLLDRLQATLQG